MIAVLAGSGAGQTATAGPEQTPAPMTLHVYTDLLQIPVLVLNQTRQPMVGLEANRFRLSVDSGPLFQPPYVRREGDDPLAVTVLVDGEGQGAAMEARVAAAVGSLAERALGPRDSVSIRAMRACMIWRTGPFAVTKPDLLAARAAAVFNEQDAAMRSATHCDTHRLWDAMATASVDLEGQKGRRVLLLITGGADRGSRTSWRQLRTLATARSVAIFALQIPRDAQRDRPMFLSGEAVSAEPDALIALCELTGGVLTPSNAAGLKQAMEGIFAMVRERYILEFERPKRMDLGTHTLEVKVSRTRALVRPAGISYPQADLAEREATDAVRTEAGRAPEPGSRRVLSGAPQ